MTLEWLVLVFGIPAILIPVVLLWGFAGCGGASVGDIGAQRPTNLRATGISASVIRLTWDDPNMAPVAFEVERTKEGESIPEVLSSTTTFDDTGLQEATTYFYKVRAIRLSDNDESDLSEQAAGRTIGVAFETDLTTDEGAHEGFTVVQRIEPARLRYSTLAGDILTPGARVRITVRGSTSGSLTLDRIYISQPAASGDPYDSAGDLSPVASGVDVAANIAVILPLIDYDLERTRPLLIAFDISANPGSGMFASSLACRQPRRPRISARRRLRRRSTIASPLPRTPVRRRFGFPQHLSGRED